MEWGQHENQNCLHGGKWWRDGLVVTMVGVRLKCSEVKCVAVIVIVGLAWK